MRYGFDGLAAQVSQVLGADPFSGHLFLFRSKRADYLKCLYWDGTGLCLFAKRLERGKFLWPPIVDGAMVLTPGAAGAAGRGDRLAEDGGARAAAPASDDLTGMAPNRCTAQA